MKVEFSRQIFEKYSNINYTKIHLFGAQLFHAEREAKANNGFSQF
jgi:hypothetical protein